ncbi:LysR family transcriptional regulator [Nitratidesulfovibrio sp. HK-II]|uniref:LysR family transcriptional regulator n=1 Tax=Nitratidesulfovibrio sp. HK-II TaxID=2009266 RepID=UPI000E2F9E4E|nr:LysR family transcriptional regulator [Nitratidesulfovibrio sp. HK-II]GBO97234.1 chromosome initiation inhibitor [Nitratidesulfovibrio sp. HK-II]
MELYQLRTFAVVADTGNLTRAAERLHASPPAVSAHIRALEDELGVALFRRTPRGMELTDAGRDLRERAGAVLAGAEGLRARALALRGEPEGEVTIALHAASNLLRVDAAHALLRASAPRVRLRLSRAMSWEVVDALRTGELDAGFLYLADQGANDGGAPVPEGLAVTPLARVGLHVIGPLEWADLLQAGTLAELAALPWLWVPCECPFCPVMERLFAAVGVEPTVAAVAEQEDALCALAAGGAGLTVMVEAEARAAVAEGRLALRERPVAHVTLAFAVPAARAEEPALAALRDAVCAAWDAGRGDAAPTAR